MRVNGRIKLLGYYKRNLINKNMWNKDIIPKIIDAEGLPDPSNIKISNEGIVHFDFELSEREMYNFRLLIEFTTVSNDYMYRLDKWSYSIHIKDNIVKGVVL